MICGRMNVPIHIIARVTGSEAIKKCSNKVMNTGEKNVHGRTIFKGPRGGTYVTGPGGKKIYKFKPAGPLAHVVAVAPSPNGPAEIIHKRARFTETNITHSNRPVYKKDASGVYYAYTTNGKFDRLVMSNKIKNRNGTTKTVKNHMKSGPGPHAPAPLASPGRPTTAERQTRLAQIRARLNQIREKLREERRVPIPNLLRRAASRVRSRLSYEMRSGTRKETVKIPLCYSKSSFPRKPCELREIPLRVYKNIPEIMSGQAVGMKKEDFDLDWFRRQNEYISNLNDYDYWTVQAHTNRSHMWIGPYTRSGRLPTFIDMGGREHITPLWPQIREMILGGV